MHREFSASRGGEKTTTALPNSVYQRVFLADSRY
jgi:hypothetical protein